MIELAITKRTDKRLLDLMPQHYSQPKGFVGRNICYAISAEGIYYGHIVAGSACKYLPGRDEFFGLSHTDSLNVVISNIFYHVFKVDRYPFRNFTTAIVAAWRAQSAKDWQTKYGDKPLGYETLIELPRTGELYRRDGWKEVGVTKGYTCKRGAGQGTDWWTGKRIWNTKNLRPKLVLVRKTDSVRQATS